LAHGSGGREAQDQVGTFGEAVSGPVGMQKRQSSRAAPLYSPAPMGAHSVPGEQKGISAFLVALSQLHHIGDQAPTCLAGDKPYSNATCVT
jgi:hypothetical protein